MFKDFFTQDSLNSHVLQYVYGAYECATCGKQLNQKASWYNHKKIYTGKMYSCLQTGCGYTVKMESHFHEHVKYYHFLTNTVKCPGCKKLFQMPSNMYHHKRVYHS